MRYDIVACSSKIDALAWQGKAHWEAAAFLRLKDEGHFMCDVWPADNHSGTAHWRGPIPGGTAAVIHSHRRHDTRPSAQDRDEACRLGVPVIVETAKSMTMVLPCRTEIVEAPIASRVSAAARSH